MFVYRQITMSKEHSTAVKAPAQAQPNFAGLWVRCAASIVDGLILTVPYLLATPALTFLSGRGLGVSEVEKIESFLDLALLLVFWSYNIFFVARTGATPGKRLLKLKVVRTDQTPVTLRRAILRETVGKLLSSVIFSLGYLWAGFDRKKQAWHDKIAGTYVVCTESLSKGRKTLAYVIALLLPGGAALGMAAALVLVAVNPVKQIDQAQDAARKNDITTLKQGLELYYTENNTYPTNLSKLTEWVHRIPKDPETGDDYVYQVVGGGKDYILKATLSTGGFYEVRGRENTPPSP